MSPGGLRALVRASPGGSLLRLIWWHWLRAWCWVYFRLCYRFRVRGRVALPRGGPVLIVSNHQSFLDPIIVGLATGARPAYSLARSSLYRGPIGWLIHSLNGIPVERGAADTKAMRRCVGVLKQGFMLSVFPEGTRTEDGQVGEFKGGTMLLIKRARPVVIPLGIGGAYEVWPRRRMLPRPFGRITAAFGAPVPAEQLLAMRPDDAMALLRQRVADLCGATQNDIQSDDEGRAA